MINTQYETVPFVTEVKRYQTFEGAIKDNMQRLLTGKDENGTQVDIPRELLTAERLAYLCVHGKEPDRTELRNDYKHVNLAVVSDPSGSGEVAFKKNSPLVPKMNSQIRLIDYCLPVSDTEYKEHKEFVFTAEEVAVFNKDGYALPDRRKEFWHFALENQAEEYIEGVCSTLNRKFDEVMGCFLHPKKGLRLLCVGSVGDYNRSNAYGSNNLVINYGRLVGVAEGTGLIRGVAPLSPEALVVAPKNLESKL